MTSVIGWLTVLWFRVHANNNLSKATFEADTFHSKLNFIYPKMLGGYNYLVTRNRSANVLKGIHIEQWLHRGLVDLPLLPTST